MQPTVINKTKATKYEGNCFKLGKDNALIILYFTLLGSLKYS